MTNIEELQAKLAQVLAHPTLGRAPRAKTKARRLTESISTRTELAPEAPAPQTKALVAEQGEEPTARALEAWSARLEGAPIVDVAHQLGVSIELAKKLISEVHAAIYEDLKENIDLNRQLDLSRIDQLIKAYLGPARAGDDDAAGVVLRCLPRPEKVNRHEAGDRPTRGANTSQNNI